MKGDTSNLFLSSSVVLRRKVLASSGNLEMEIIETHPKPIESEMGSEKQLMF